MKPISTRLFHRVLMPRHPSSERHPAVIMLHGRGADEEDLLGIAPALDPGLMVLSVRAPYPFAYGGGYTWYDVGEVGTPEPTMFASSYGSLVAFVDEVCAGYPIDTGRLFLYGFSMGSVMSFALGLTLPERFRGIVANSGYVPERTHLELRWDALAATSFFIAHGTQDPVIPVALARRARELFAASNAPISYTEYPMGHEISEGSLDDTVRWMAPLLTRGAG